MCRFQEISFACLHTYKTRAVVRCDKADCKFISTHANTMVPAEELPDHMFRSEHLVGVTCRECSFARTLRESEREREIQKLKKTIEEMKKEKEELEASRPAPAAPSLPSPPLPPRDPARNYPHQSRPSQPQGGDSSIPQSSNQPVMVSNKTNPSTSSPVPQSSSWFRSRRFRPSQPKEGARPCRQLPVLEEGARPYHQLPRLEGARPCRQLPVLEEDWEPTFDTNIKFPTHQNRSHSSNNICGSGPCRRQVVQDSKGQKGIFCKKHTCEARDWECLNDSYHPLYPKRKTKKYCMEHTCDYLGCNKKVVTKNGTRCKTHADMGKSGMYRHA